MWVSFAQRINYRWNANATCRRSAVRTVERAVHTVTDATWRRNAANRVSTLQSSTSTRRNRSGAKWTSVSCVPIIRSVRLQEPLAVASIPADMDVALIHTWVELQSIRTGNQTRSRLEGKANGHERSCHSSCGKDKAGLTNAGAMFGKIVGPTRCKN